MLLFASSNGDESYTLTECHSLLTPFPRPYFERTQRSDPQRKKIALVATAHYLVRVMWAMLKRGTVWEENLALDK